MAVEDAHPAGLRPRREQPRPARRRAGVPALAQTGQARRVDESVEERRPGGIEALVRVLLGRRTPGRAERLTRAGIVVEAQNRGRDRLDVVDVDEKPVLAVVDDARVPARRAS